VNADERDAMRRHAERRLYELLAADSSFEPRHNAHDHDPSSR
jgi:hypothetical protein